MNAGEVFKVVYPFVRSTYTAFDDDPEGSGYADVPTWKPGVRYVQIPPEGDTRSVADGLGRMVLTVVSTHKPGKYPLRVFYTRQWVTPEGKTFGKSKCHIATAEKFKRLARGYQHEYTLDGCTCGACKWPFHDHRQQSESYTLAQEG